MMHDLREAMRTLITIALLTIGSGAAYAQNTIYGHAIGNWRNGPVVHLSPVFETSEALSREQHLAQYRDHYPVLRNIPDNDLDVLLFATREEAEESRANLRAKYARRELPVELLPREVPAGP
jgi:hypothetical protein